MKSKVRQRLAIQAMVVLILSIFVCLAFFHEEIHGNALVQFERMRVFLLKPIDPMFEFDRLRDATIEHLREKRFKEGLVIIAAAERLASPFGKHNVYLARVLGLKAWCLYGLGQKHDARLHMKKSIDMWIATKGSRVSWLASAYRDLALMTDNHSQKQEYFDQAQWCIDHCQGPRSLLAWEISGDAAINHCNTGSSFRASHGLRGIGSIETVNIFGEEGRDLCERLSEYQKLRDLNNAMISIIRGDKTRFGKLELNLLQQFKLQDANRKLLRGTSWVYFQPNCLETITQRQRDHLRALSLNRQACLLHSLGQHEEAAKLDLEADQIFEKEND